MRFFTLKRGSVLQECSTFKLVCATFFLCLFFVNKTNGQTNSFTNIATFGPTNANTRTYHARVIDYDNDGDNDFTFTDEGNNLRLYLNPGNGIFTTYTTIISPGAFILFEPIDVDNDGDMDFVGSNGKVYANNGSGTFTIVSGLTLKQNAGGGISFLKAIDINNDGKKDIIWANDGNSATSYNEIWLNTTSGSSISFSYYAGISNENLSGRTAIDMGDVDKDGDLDVVLSGGSAQVYLNNSGSFSLSQTLTNYSGINRFIDWDNDDDLDIIGAESYNSVGLLLRSNNGSGTFATTVSLYGSNQSAAVFGDLNGDGLVDAIVGTQVLINRGSCGVFVSQTLNNLPILLSDFTGDGKLDVFMATNYVQSTIWKNDLSLVSTKTDPGNALNFDGTNDYVSIPDANSLDLISSYTIEAWIKPSSFSAAAGIVSKYHTVASNGYLLRLAGTAPYTGINFDGLETATGILEADKWYHIAAVKSGSARTLYINGVAVAMPNGSAITTAANTDVLAIGVDYLASPRYFNGSIDEVRIWNVARTPSEITTNNKTSITACSNANLVAYYKFDNGTVSGSNGSYYAANDLSTNNNNGILTNFALTGATSNWVESYAMVVPTATSATGISSTGFTANWTAPTTGTVSNYLLDVSTSSSFSSFVSGYNGLSVSGTSQAVTGLSAVTTYYYRVRADKTSVTGQGAYSSTITALTSMQPPGNALNFDGTDDRVAVTNANLPQGNASRTVETWVKTSGPNTQMSIFSYGNNSSPNQMFSIILLNGVYLVGNNNDIQTSVYVNDGKWHHLAVTHDGTTTKIYVDGNLINSTAKTFNTTGTNFQMGYNSTYTAWNYNGTLDEMRVWNTARTQAEIQANMYSTISGSTSGLVAYYNFDNGIAGGTNTGLTTLTDQSSSAANATLTNFALTGATSNWVESYAMVVPTATSATGISSTGFTANWTAPTTGTVSNYLLDVSTSSSFSSFVSGYNGLSVSGISQALTGLSAVTTYYYRVRADKTSVTGQGAYSVSATTQTKMTPPGNALNSDGANDIISGNNTSLPQGNAARTIETWVKNSAGNDMTIFNYGDPAGGNNQLFALHLYNGVYIIGQNNDIGTNYNINDGKWHHLAVTHDGTTTKIYVDGNLINSTAKTYNTTGTSFQIASMNRSGYRFFFNGTLDEMRVWNTARTQAEIQANMHNTISASTSGLVAYYDFDNGVAGGTNTGLTSLTDLSSSAANGTLANFALIGSTSNWVTSTAFGNTWIGTASTTFNTAANWSFGTIPLATDNIYIPSGVSNMPIVAGTQSINNLDMQSGASLTVTGNLKIAGSITNAGTLTATSGTVELNGSSAQTIAANTFASNTVQNLTINNSAGVSLGGALTVTGVLTPTAGVLTTGGNLTLASNATGTASIAAGTGTYLSGTVNVQRYSQAQRGYRTFAHPYTTTQSVRQLVDNFQITGLTTTSSSLSGTYGTTTGNPSIFYYDGTKPAGTTAVLGRIYNADSLNWPVGKGLYAFVRGNGNEGTGGSYASSGGAPSPLVLDVKSGNINQGNVTVNLTPYTVGADNYTLVGNPYPCPINLSGVTGISSFGTIYLYNPVYSAGATTLVRGGFESTNSNNIVIPSMGCFYIQSTASTPSSITFHESDKITSGTPNYTVFGSGNQPQPKLELQLSTADGFMDKTTVALDNTSSNSATDFHDAAKLGNSLVNFYSLSSDNKALAIDYRDNLNTAIPLSIQTTNTTNYTISLSELIDLPNTQVVLKDKLLKTETVLSKVGDGYSFDITADTASKGDNRFEIGLLGTTVLPVQIADITAQLQANKTVAVNWTSSTEVNLASYKVQRSKDGSNFTTVSTVAAKGASAYNYTDDLSTAGILPSIIYYRLEAVDKDGSKTYSKVVSCQLSVASKAISIYPNPVQATLYAQVTVTKAGAAQLRVVDAQGKVVATQKTQLAIGTTSISIPAAQLAAGNYVLEIDSADGKQTQRFVKE